MNKCRRSKGDAVAVRFGSIGRTTRNYGQIRYLKGARGSSLLLLPSLLPPARQHFVAEQRQLPAICLPSTTFTGILSLSLVENNNASHIQITPPSQPACTHYVTNYHLPDSTATNQPTIACPPASLDGGQGEHIFAALYALFPSSLSPNDFLAAVSLRKSRLRRREGGN